MASLAMWASSALVLAWQCTGARIDMVQGHDGDITGVPTYIKRRAKAPGTKLIAGIPVYNYHRAKARLDSGPINLVELSAEDAAGAEVSWNVVMKDTISDKEMNDFCQRNPNGCAFKGDPEDGGLPVLQLIADLTQLESMLHEGGEGVRFLEPEMDVFIIPEDPFEKKDEDPTADYRFGRKPPKQATPNKPRGALGIHPHPPVEEPVPNRPLVAPHTSIAPWGLERIGVPAHNLTGEGVNVYVVDTGIHTTHHDFDGRAHSAWEVNGTSGRECKGDPHCAVDEQGHGTHCAGTVAGTKYGVAKKAQVHAVKVLGADGSGTMSGVLQGMNWVKKSAVEPAVVSMSLGGGGTSEAMKAAVEGLVSVGIPVVVAAGNEGEDACYFSPAFVRSAITVGATDKTDKRPSWSNTGSCVDIFAPGVNIVSLSNKGDDEVAVHSGTSMACPHVAGTVALIFEQMGREVSVNEITTRLIDTAEHGVIDEGSLTPLCPNTLLSVKHLHEKKSPFPKPRRSRSKPQQ